MTRKQIVIPIATSCIVVAAGLVPALMYCVAASAGVWTCTTVIAGAVAVGIAVGVWVCPARPQQPLQLRKLQEAIEQSPASVVITDKNGVIEYVNPMFTQVTGYESEEVLGKNPRIWKSGSLSSEFYADMWTTIKSGRIWRGDFINHRKDGSEFWERASISPIRNTRGKVTHYVAVKSDITADKKREEELWQAKNEAEAASRAKSTFLTNISHEIRTPMNAIVGFSQLLRRQGKLNAKQDASVYGILRSSEHLLGLINEVLEMSKIESGRVTVKNSTFNLRLLLDDLETMIRVSAEEKCLELRFQIAADTPDYFHADEDKLRQILINLLSNAVKYTEYGSITVTVRPGPESTLQVAVEDTGIGIAEDQLDRVFGYFEQVESSYQSGTGIGLAISQQFAELMHGKITVTSRSGSGSCFTLRLPHSPVPVQSIVPECDRDIATLAPNQRHFVALAIGCGSFVCKPLEMTGITVVEADSVHAAARHNPDVVFLDIELAAAQKFAAAHELSSRVPAPILTIGAASAKRYSDTTLAEAGIAEHLDRPFQNTQLFKLLTKHAGIHFIHMHQVPQPTVPPTSSDLFHVPDLVQRRIQKAIDDHDMELLRKSIDDIRNQDPKLAEILLKLAAKTDFDGILMMTQDCH